jgi:hypothetical protein
MWPRASAALEKLREESSKGYHRLCFFYIRDFVVSCRICIRCLGDRLASGSTMDRHRASDRRVINRGLHLPAHERSWNRFHRRLKLALEPLKSFRKICPSFITNLTRSNSVTSFEGSPETPMISANLPFSMARLGQPSQYLPPRPRVCRSALLRPTLFCLFPVRCETCERNEQKR